MSAAQWIVIISTLSGVLIGFLLTFVRDRVEANRQRSRLAVALLAEASALFERYQEVFGSYIAQLQEGQTIEQFGGGFTGAFHQEFFSVFDANTDKLGLFRAGHVGTIVRAYIMAKAHIETLNYALTQLDEIRRSALSSGPDGESASAAHAHRLLTELTPILRRESADLTAAAPEVLQILAGYAGRVTGRRPDQQYATVFRPHAAS